jgi:hypothetical protein
MSAELVASVTETKECFVCVLRHTQLSSVAERVLIA